MQGGIQDMLQTFEQELYEAVARAFPGLTVRAMSRLLGKSSGYWSSVSSQNLPLSTDALTHLSEVIECQQIMCPPDSRRGQRLADARRLICEQLSVRLELLRSYASTNLVEAGYGNFRKNETYQPMPFLMSTYCR
jgi:hypothetical protein